MMLSNMSIIMSGIEKTVLTINNKCEGHVATGEQMIHDKKYQFLMHSKIVWECKVTRIKFLQSGY